VPKAQIVRLIEMPRSDSRERKQHYYVYIDCDTRYHDAVFKINGVVIQKSLISANKIDSARYFLFNIMRMCSCVFDLPVDSLRQWRVLEIPAGAIRAGTNILSVSAGAQGLSVFADSFDRGEQAWRLPGRDSFSASKIYTNGLYAQLEGRILEPFATARYWPAAQCQSFSNSPRDLLTQPRIFMLLARPWKTSGALVIDPRPPFESELSLNLFDPVLRVAGENKALKIDRYTLQLARTCSAFVKLPERFSKARALDICLKGKLKRIGRNDKVGVLLTLTADKPLPLTILPGSPPFVVAENQYKEFAVRDRVPVSNSPKGLTLGLSLFPGRWEQISQYGVDRNVGSFLLKDLKLSISEVSSIDLAESQIVLR
jgi:hypothetical protein